MDGSGALHRVFSFLGNVGVNVLANLLAAAIIYLGGVALGVFPPSQRAVAAAIVTLTTGPIVWISFAWLIWPSDSPIRRIGSAVILGVTGVLATVGGLMQAPWPKPEWLSASLSSWFYTIVGILFVLLAANAIRLDVAKSREDHKADSRIRGLKWIDLT